MRGLGTKDDYHASRKRGTEGPRGLPLCKVRLTRDAKTIEKKRSRWWGTDQGSVVPRKHKTQMRKLGTLFLIYA